MPRLTVNPEAEVSNFCSVKEGTYPMTVKEVVDRNPEKNDLKVTFSHVLAQAELVDPDGEALKGQASNVIDYVQLAYDKQWKLRQLVEACGMEWSDLDTDDLVGKEVDVVIKVEEYQGEKRNKVGRYVKKA